MKSDTDYLKEAQHLVDTAERERRSLTDDERRRAESALKEVQAIRDHKALTNMIEGFNGSLMGRSPMKSRGAPALDFSMQQVKMMHAAAQSATHYKADIDSVDAPMAGVGDYRTTPRPKKLPALSTDTVGSIRGSGTPPAGSAATLLISRLLSSA